MKYKPTFAVGLLAFIFISCTTNRYIYSASPANNPLFTRKGDSKLAGYYSADANSNTPKEYARGLDLQGGYAFGNHWGLIAGYFKRRERDINHERGYENTFINYKRNLIEIGAGYFTPLNKNKDITGNFYVGVANGKFSFEENNFSRYHESAISKWFFQPSLNFIPSNYVRISFAARVSFVHYGNIKTTYTPEELIYYSLNKIENNTICFFEPSFNIQFGISKIPWVKTDFVFSGSSNYQAGNPRLDVRGSNISLGLSFDFSKIKKK